MIFRKTIIATLFIGLVAGLVFSLAQVSVVNPIIFEAETFELDQSHDHASHEHSHEAWAPEEGAQRTGYTVLANVFAGIGFAAVLLAIMSQCQLLGMARVKPLKGLVWGAAGFIVFFVAPGIGLPPEIPGITAVAVEHRQLWWVFTVLAAGLGLMIISFAPLKVKVLGIAALVLPYFVGIPHHEGPTFAHPDAQAVAALTQLHQLFIAASGASNLIFWLILGVLSAWLLNAFVLKNVSLGGGRNEPVTG